MGTLLQTIQSTPKTVYQLIEHRKENNQQAIHLIDQTVKKDFDEIIIIGSGSSLNEAKSVRGFIEKITHKRVIAETSNDFMYNHTEFSKKHLYIFMSQSGTSETTRRAQDKIKKLGCTTIAISSETKKFLATEADAVVDSMAAHEEYLCVTLGFTASLTTLALLGVSIAEYLETVSPSQADEIVNDLKKAVDHYDAIISTTEKWYKVNEKNITNVDYYAVYGADDLWGVALEGALKILEIPKLFAVGYELEDGMHGPTLAFDERICLFILNDGGRENDRALSLARFTKEEFGNGFVIGSKGLDEQDLHIDFTSKYFNNIELACAMQTICWFISVSKGVDLTIGHGVTNRKSKKRYFSTHSEVKI